jgi:hypothetical protein
MQKEGKSQTTVSDAEYIFNVIILRSDSDRMISHYEHRLEETVGDQFYQVSIHILDKLCDGAKLTIKDTMDIKEELKLSTDLDIHYLLAVFTHDGYLVQLDRVWAFEYCLLRKCWQGRRDFR